MFYLIFNRKFLRILYILKVKKNAERQTGNQVRILPRINYVYFVGKRKKGKKKIKNVFFFFLSLA